MSNASEKYQELVTLTQLYLFQHFSLNTTIAVEKESFSFFKKYSAAFPVEEIHFASNVPKSVSRPSPQVFTAPKPTKQQHAKRTHSLSSPSTTASHQSKESSQKQVVTVAQEKPQQPSSTVALHPLPPTSPEELSDIRKIVKESCPEIKIVEAPKNITLPRSSPTSKEHSILKQGFVPILSFDQEEEKLTFFKNISKALTLVFKVYTPVIPAQEVEKRQEWEKWLAPHRTRFFVASAPHLHLLPRLMGHYHCSQDRSRHFLKQIPLLLIPDVSLYLREPHQKRFLWNALKIYGMN